ncbi:MAG: hypothetical protein MHM6MM_009679 [Cercozoa sp. M6MM]
MRFIVYLIKSTLVSAVTYPVVAHWIWHKDGWLAKHGFVDFAGSAVVHAVGGTCALICCVVLGPRTGRYIALQKQQCSLQPSLSENGVVSKEIQMSDCIVDVLDDSEVDAKASGAADNVDDVVHSASLENKNREAADTIQFMRSDFLRHLDFSASRDNTQLLSGTLILWIGWFSFNAGSTLQMSSLENARLSAFVATNTALGGAAGGLAGLLGGYWVSGGHFPARDLSNGVLCGLVSITSMVHCVEIWQSVLIGGLGGFIPLGVGILFAKLHIDDPVCTVAVHLFGGVWSVLAVGLFAHNAGPGVDLLKRGMFYGGSLFSVQLYGICSVVAWAALTSGLFLFVLSHLTELRVDETKEVYGLDKSEHGIDSDARFFAMLVNFSSAIERLRSADLLTDAPSAYEKGLARSVLNQRMKDILRDVSGLDRSARAGDLDNFDFVALEERRPLLI